MNKLLLVTLAFYAITPVAESMATNEFGCFDDWPPTSASAIHGVDILNPSRAPMTEILEYARGLTLTDMSGAHAFTLTGEVRSQVKPEPGMCYLTANDLAAESGGRLIAGVTSTGSAPGAGLTDGFTAVWLDQTRGAWRLVMINTERDERVEVPVEFVAGTVGWPTACSGKETSACWESAQHPDNSTIHFDRLVVAGVNGGYLRAARPLR